MTKILLAANTDWFLYNFRKDLVRFLLDSGFEVVLVSPPGPYASSLMEMGYRWICWDVTRRSAVPWEEIRSLFQLFRIYQRENPDIVHHHTIKLTLYGSLAARWANVPRVVNSISGRGYVFLGEDLQARILRKVINPFFKRIFKGPKTVLIFENDFDYQFFIASGFSSPSQSWIIEGVGSDPDVFFPTPEDAGVPVVVMAGRMLWDKGVGVFVEAARKLNSRVTARFVLVGKPDPGNPGTIKEAVLRKWQDEGVVEWWGWQEEMVSVYRRCHIVALPTKYGEGVPTSLIEGAASGRPLVATDIPGCLPVVHNEVNGYIVPPDDPAALALALETLIMDPALRQKMGKASRQIFLEKFTYAKVNDATLGVYKHVLDEV